MEEEWICVASEGDLYGIERTRLIRCKECRHCEINADGYTSYCKEGHDISYVNGYCSEAEPKTRL